MDERRATAFGTLPWGRLLSGTVAGLYVSDDRGRPLAPHQRRGPLDPDDRPPPGRPERVFLGTEGAGVWVSTDGGDSVRPSSDGDDQPAAGRRGRGRRRDPGGGQPRRPGERDLRLRRRRADLPGALGGAAHGPRPGGGGRPPRAERGAARCGRPPSGASTSAGTDVVPGRGLRRGPGRGGDRPATARVVVRTHDEVWERQRRGGGRPGEVRRDRVQPRQPALGGDPGRRPLGDRRRRPLPGRGRLEPLRGGALRGGPGGGRWATGWSTPGPRAPGLARRARGRRPLGAGRARSRPGCSRPATPATRRSSSRRTASACWTPRRARPRASACRSRALRRGRPGPRRPPVPRHQRLRPPVDGAASPLAASTAP